MVLKTKTNVLSNRILLLLAVAAFLINQLPCLADMRGMGNDESWYANVAYNLSAGNGLYQTSVGYIGGNCLYPMLEAVAFLLFGYSLFAVRIASVFCGVMTLVLLHFIMNELHVSMKSRALAFLLFVGLPVFNTAFRFGRPEGAALMCLSGGILFYLRYWRTRNWGDMLGLCLSCFMSPMAHPFALFSFLFMGIALLGELWRNREWKRLPQMSLLVMAAVLGIGIVAILSSIYNPSERTGLFFDRVSPRNAINAAAIYFKVIFLSRYALYSYPIVLLLVSVGRFVKEKRLRVLAWFTLINGLLFPFVFSTDVVMLPFGWHYVVLIGVALSAPLMDFVDTRKTSSWSRKLIHASLLLYAVVCLAFSYVYNAMKYEKCNSVLEKDMAEIIPQGSLVYGPICMYFCAIDTHYYSDHYYTDSPLHFDFDYLIFNSRDLPLYPMSQDLYGRVADYDLKYSRSTKQYGMVQVFGKRKR